MNQKIKNNKNDILTVSLPEYINTSICSYLYPSCFEINKKKNYFCSPNQVQLLPSSSKDHFSGQYGGSRVAIINVQLHHFSLVQKSFSTGSMSLLWTATFLCTAIYA